MHEPAAPLPLTLQNGREGGQGPPHGEDVAPLFVHRSATASARVPLTRAMYETDVSRISKHMGFQPRISSDGLAASEAASEMPERSTLSSLASATTQQLGRPSGSTGVSNDPAAGEK
eukprot:7391873-Prymnesium_polylepis.1